MFEKLESVSALHCYFRNDCLSIIKIVTLIFCRLTTCFHISKSVINKAISCNLKLLYKARLNRKWYHIFNTIASTISELQYQNQNILLQHIKMFTFLI